MSTIKAKKEKLERSESNRVVAGVCGGLGEFLGIDPTVIRWAFAIFTLFGGSGFLVYLVLWLLIPSPTGTLVDKKNLEEGVAKVKKYAEDHNPGKIIGVLLLVFGVTFLLDNFRIVPWAFLNYLWRFWPVAVILWGLELISGKTIFGKLLIALIILAGLFYFLPSKLTLFKDRFPLPLPTTQGRKIFQCDPATGECKATYR